MEQPKPLSGPEKKQLRGLAQRLKPHVHVGKKGLSETVFNEIDVALTKNGLVKVRYEAERDTIKDLANATAEKLGCEHIGGVGKTVVLFRDMPELPES